MKNILESFLNQYYNALKNDINLNEIYDSSKLIEKTLKNGGKLIFVGNGGSAAMASHVSVDFTKNAGIKSINFNEPDLITCFANDFGYDNWVVQAIKYYGSPKDLIFLISSSGNSMNIVNAANYCIKEKINVITLSGFNSDNKLRKLGKINFWVNSSEYNIVEMTHHIILLLLVDGFINKKN